MKPNDRIRQELIKSGITHDFDHWYLHTDLNAENLERFLDKYSHNLTKNSEIFTSELLQMQSKLVDELSINKIIDLSCQADDFSMKLTDGQPWTLWLGHPWLDDGRLYNTYSRWQNGKPTFRHRKKFPRYEKGYTWEIEKFHVERWLTKWTSISTEIYDGLIDNKAILICNEVAKFYDAVYKRPTRIEEVYKAQPDFIIAPSWWILKKDKKTDILKTSMHPIVRRIIDEKLDSKAVRPQGCVAAAINYNDVYVIGPYPYGNTKAAVYARTKTPGYVRLNNDGVEIGKI